MAIKFFATMKKTAGENNLVASAWDTKSLLDLHLLDDVSFGELMLFDDSWDLIVEEIKKYYIPYENTSNHMVKINDFDYVDIKAGFKRTYVYSKKTGNLRYRVCEMTGAKLTVIRHKTKAWNDVGEAQSVFVGSKYAHTVDRQDVEI